MQQKTIILRFGPKESGWLLLVKDIGLCVCNQGAYADNLADAVKHDIMISDVFFFSDPGGRRLAPKVNCRDGGQVVHVGGATLNPFLPTIHPPRDTQYAIPVINPVLLSTRGSPSLTKQDTQPSGTYSQFLQ